jgi:WhiB family redox-sensing transcriptional regulator
MPNDSRLPAPVGEHGEWQVLAACRWMDVERFFHPQNESAPVRDKRIAAAKLVCRDCPVLAECRTHALTTREPYGVRGGLSESERARILGVRSLRHQGARTGRSKARPLPVRQAVGGGRFGPGGTA